MEASGCGRAKQSRPPEARRSARSAEEGKTWSGRSTEAVGRQSASVVGVELSWEGKLFWRPF